MQCKMQMLPGLPKDRKGERKMIESSQIMTFLKKTLLFYFFFEISLEVQYDNFFQNLNYKYLLKKKVQPDIIHFQEMLTTEAGIQDPRFVDINKAQQHRFPEEVHNIGFSVTLLHNHSHAPKHSCLAYSEDFKTAEYLAQAELQKYYPCSWFLSKDHELVAYEFSSVKIDYNPEKVMEELETLKKMGYNSYGITVRPIESNVEVETKTGHKYFPQATFQAKEGMTYAQTATNGRKMDACYAYTTCVVTFMQAHVKDYGHDVY